MSNLSSEVSEIVSKYIEAGHFTGAITMLSCARNCNFLQAQGYGDDQGKFALEVDTVFPLFSMTKPIIAACASLLIAEGKFSPQDPVSKWIPAFAKPRQVRSLAKGETFVPHMGFGPPDGPLPKYEYSPAYRDILINDLMNFTSGLQTIGVYNEHIPPITLQETLQSWVDKLGEVPLEFQPGTRWHYSNSTGYDVLGRLIEVVSDMPLAQFVADRIFMPLGMNDSAFGLQANAKGRVAPLGMFADTPVVRSDYASGSAGLFSTAKDYSLFAQMMLNRGMHDGQQVIPNTAVDMMVKNQIGGLGFPGVRAAEYAQYGKAGQSGLEYGYGVALVAGVVEGLAVPAGSYGWGGIGSRRFWVMPEYDAVLIMLMTGVGPVADVAHMEIEKLVCRHLAQSA